MGKRTQLASVARLDALGARGSLGRSFDIADIAGVIDGIKPAAIVAPALSFSNKRDRVAYERVLKQLGLESLPVDDTAGWNAIIAKDSTILEELRRAVVAVDALFQKSIAAGANEHGGFEISDKDEKTIGRLLGYPKTATVFFIRRMRSLSTPDELPITESRLTDNRRFFEQLILSPEHYDEEVRAYITPLERAVRELVPKTYARIVAEGLRLEAREETD